MSNNVLSIEALDRDAFSPYGVMLGAPPDTTAAPPSFFSNASDFWREHLFDNGTTEETEILWVRYRSQSTEVATLEAHHLTQQAIVPLTGPLLQIVATSHSNGLPDLTSMRVFRVDVGQGICMNPDIWHATRVTQNEVTALMLTRPSTTYDLAVHLRTGAPITESSLQAVESHKIALT